MLNNNIDNTIKKITIKYKKFLIGYSGGVDSSVLLYSINKFKNKTKIRAIHINHHSNKKSIEAQQHCIKTCKKLNIKIIIDKIKIKNKKNIEHKFRQKRYNIYQKNLKKNEILLTAHHINDQSETIILSLKRGSGLEGISGINKIIYINDKIIIRPFLKIYKNEIIKYAIKNNILWFNDITNKNIELDRNFIRIKILPLLTKRWPSFISCITRSAYICKEQKIIINNLLTNKIKNFFIKKKILNLKKMYLVNKKINYLIIRKILKNNKIQMLSYKITKKIWKTICENKNKIYFKIKLKKITFYKYKNYLYLNDNIKKIKIKNIKWHNNYNKIILPNNIGSLSIIKNKIKNKYSIRMPKKNEKIYIKFNIKKKIKILWKNKKKIKKIWQEYKILPWERKITPIVFYNKKAIICPNLFITQNSYIKKNKKFINIHFKKNKNFFI